VSSAFDRFDGRLIIVPMQAESLEVLEKADVPPAQARAIVRAIEIEIAGAKDTLATKHDLLQQRQDFQHEFGNLRQEMAELRTALRGEMTELRTALRGEMTELRAALEGKMGALLTDVLGQMAGLRGDLRAEIHASAGGVTRQMYMALLGQMVVLLGFAYFFATNIA
jgi:hypothetical protein